jgi:hypothetical protein
MYYIYLIYIVKFIVYNIYRQIYLYIVINKFICILFIYKNIYRQNYLKNKYVSSCRTEDSWTHNLDI